MQYVTGLFLPFRVVQRFMQYVIGLFLPFRKLQLSKTAYNPRIINALRDYSRYTVLRV